MDEHHGVRSGQGLGTEKVGDGHLEVVEPIEENQIHRPSTRPHRGRVGKELGGRGGHEVESRVHVGSAPGDWIDGDDPGGRIDQGQRLPGVHTDLQVQPGPHQVVDVGQQVVVRGVGVVHRSRRHQTPVQSMVWIGSVTSCVLR